MSISVLIIDSDIVYTTNICRTLYETKDIEVIGIEYDGIKGLDRIYTAQPDVVIMDVQLPGMDGISVLKESRLMKHPPVTIISTHFYSEFCVVSAQQNGAAYILYKPIDYHTFPQLLRECYKAVRTAAYKEKQQTQKREIKVNDVYKVRTMLFELGMPPRFVGCLYLVESILLASENKMLLENLSKGLYAEIAHKLNTTPAGIERSLRNAIASTYEHGNLSDIFDHRPTNKQFLIYLMKRLADTASVAGMR